MPVSPDDASNLAKSMLDLYSEAETSLLAMVARRLARGIDSPGWEDRQLLALQGLRSDTQRLVDTLKERSTTTLADVLRLAWNRGAALAGDDMVRAGLHQAFAFSGVNLNAVAALLTRNQSILAPTGLRIQSSAGSIFQDVVRLVAGRMLTGQVTRRQAAVQAIDRFAEQGITGFTDTAGRAWSMTGYAEMVTRTAASQAIVQGHVEQLSTNGFDLVMVSDAPEECVKCRRWEGAILALSGNPAKVMTRNGHTFTVAGTLAEATAAGLLHPNCRHRLIAFVPGVTERLRDTADPEGDKLRQQQRAYERKVRELKRRLAAAQELDPKGDSTKAARLKLRTKQAEFKQWREDNGRKDLAYRTSIT